MRILFTGASSLAGRRLFSLLKKQGHDVVGLTRRPPSAEGFWRADLADPEFHRTLPNESFDVLIHFASYVPASEATSAWADCTTMNLHGTARLLAWADGKIQRVILASSCAIYGEPAYAPIDERHPLRPQTAYAISKYGQEQIVQAFCRSRGLPLLVLRLGYVYGPDMPEQRIIKRFIKMIRAGERVRLVNSQTTGLNLIHQDDIARLSASLLGAQGTYNMGSDAFISLKDYVDAVMQVTNQRTDVVCEDTPGAPKTNFYTSGLWHAYRAKPAISLHEGIAGLIKAGV